MSCGKLHEAGEPFHLHAPGEEHEMPGEAEPGTELAEAAPEPPGRVRMWLAATSGQVKTAAAGAWAQHGYLVKPFAVIPAMEGSEWLIEQVYGGDWARALAAAAAAAAAGEITTETVNHVQKRARPVRARSRLAVVVAAACMAVGGAGTFDGPVALGTLAAGATVGGMLAYEKHKAHRDRPPAALEAAAEPLAVTAGPAPLLVQFTGAFCGPGGKLVGARASCREITNGILFELDLTGTEHGPDDAAAIVKAIAKEFNVTRDSVSVEYVPEPGKHSENYCQVVIRKIPVLDVTEPVKSRVRPWDGQTTYDAATGCVDLGWFTDGKVTHFQFHEPGSGAKHTFLAGATGAGKTGTVNILGCEAGLAKLCRACGYARACPSCSLERVMAVWMASAAEGTGLSVWHDRADLSAAGPGGSLEMLEFAAQVARDRAAYRATMPWEDTDPRTGERRLNRGKDNFDVEIGHPLIFFVLDEFPELVGPEADPLMRDIALGIIIRALNTWRKLGIHLLLASGSADTTLIGDRLIRDLIASLNIIGHRVDDFSASMIGLIGDASKLPRDLPGAGLTNGYDQRDSEFATKFARTHHQPGDLTDIRSIAGEISRTPLLYDPPVRRLMAEGQWNIKPRHQFTEWYGRQQAEAAAGSPFTGLSAVPPMSPAPAAASPHAVMTQAARLAETIHETAEAALAAAPQAAAAAGTVPAEDLDRILSFLAANPGPHSLGSIVNGIFQADGTRMSVATVLAAAPALHAGGRAVYAGKKLQAA